MPDQVWTPLALIKVVSGFLAQKGIASARLDAEVLLCHVLKCGGRVDLYAGFERKLEPAEVDAYRELIRRRAAREPVSRILGEREFMGIRFRITPDVFSPRPETEILVEAVVRMIEGPRRRRSDPPSDAGEGNAPEGVPPSAQVGASSPSAEAPNASPRILDLGTGSGAIAVSLAVLCPQAQVVAVDISDKALAVARENAAAAGANGRVEFRQGDGFGACREGEAYDFILSNPPYLAEGDPAIEPEARDHDPAVALYAAEDGLAIHRRIVSGVEAWLSPGGSLLLEVGAGQADAVFGMLKTGTLLEEVRSLSDHAGIARVVAARRPLP